jgi:hypothetical protein
MNSSELNSIPAHTAVAQHPAELREVAQAQARRQYLLYWVALAGTILFIGAVIFWWVRVPGQDHLASIPLERDGSWYFNLELNFEIQDQEIFYHDIGQSIESARQADIIFLGWSKLLFALDWRQFGEFEERHRLKMFNMGFAGISSGEFSLRVIQKWGLHPKIWVINADRDLRDHQAGFFYLMLFGGPRGSSDIRKVVHYSRLRAYKNVVGRNVRWRLKNPFGLPQAYSYRSARTGNWYLDDWPSYIKDNNPVIKPSELVLVDGTYQLRDRVDYSCPVLPEEVEEARHYLDQIGGATVLIQVPSAMACAQRVHELAAAVGVPAFTVDETQFSTIDGGGHLDRNSAGKYTAMLLGWLEQTPVFRESFPGLESTN